MSTDKLVPGRRKTTRELKKSVNEKIRRVAREKAKKQKELTKVSHKLAVTKYEAKKLENALRRDGPAVVTGETVEALTPTAEEYVQQEENVIFKPNPGPQTEFLAASEDEVLYGGARGGGKSYSMLVDPLRHCDNKHHSFLLIRRTMPELRDLIHQSKQLYPKAYPGARFREQDKEWVFPSGARGLFGYAESPDDAMRYQGQPYTWIGIDELGQFPTPEIWNNLRGSLRSVDPNIPTYMRATANPGGPGQNWIKKMFITPSEPNKTFYQQIETKKGIKTLSRRFIPAKLADNPYLLQTDQYMIMLASLPEHKRKQWLEGDWDVTEGAAFPEFDRQIHVCSPFPIPKTWPRFRAADWGYHTPACILWFAIDYNNDLWVYREQYFTQTTADVAAKRILEAERDDPRPMRGVMDSSVWAKRGDIGPTVAETLNRMGCAFRPSDRSPNSRIAGKQEVHRRLAIDPITKKPRLKIFSNCLNLIETLPTLPLDENNLEDVDTDADDHAYDALRYGVMSRPISPGKSYKLWEPVMPRSGNHISDTTFGY